MQHATLRKLELGIREDFHVIDRDTLDIFITVRGFRVLKLGPCLIVRDIFHTLGIIKASLLHILLALTFLERLTNLFSASLFCSKIFLFTLFYQFGKFLKTAERKYQ